MPNVMSVLKAEITRLAKKEAKAAVDPVRKPSIGTRKTLADLKQRVATLEKQVKGLTVLLSKMPQPQPEPVAGQKARITGKGMRSLQRKLRLTREQFAKLVGITASGVYLWERKNGPLRVREATRAAILAIRNLTAGEAKERLAHPQSELIFLNGRGTPYTRYSFKTRLARLCRRAKTSRIFTPYALRHTFASMESDAGVETTGLARMMGHSTTRTLERYVSNTFESHRKAVTALQDRLNAVVERAENGRKCATECATEKTGTKKTCDAIVASPSASAS